MIKYQLSMLWSVRLNIDYFPTLHHSYLRNRIKFNLHLLLTVKEVEKRQKSPRDVKSQTRLLEI